jgi:hypothetical protein
VQGAGEWLFLSPSRDFVYGIDAVGIRVKKENNILAFISIKMFILIVDMPRLFKTSIPIWGTRMLALHS